MGRPAGSTQAPPRSAEPWRVDARFRILFVDDEPLILEGLRRTLRRHAEHWTAAFATGGDEALEVLAEADPPFDAIVSDLRMPGMDGLTLLEHVRAAHPTVTRVLLSGSGPSRRYDDGLLVAHQFLAKPCEAERLRTTLARIRTIRALVDDPAVYTVVGRAGHLLSVPRTYWQLAELLAEERTSLAELTAIVERDPGLAARVLQLANSSFFAIGRPTQDVATALPYLGTEVVRGLALAAHLYARARAHVSRRALEVLEQRALVAATVARQLAPPLLGDAAFTAGLMLELGTLILLDAGEAAAALDPDQVAAYALGVWGLPDALIEAVGCHRHPARVAHGDTALVLAVHVAGAVVHAAPGARPPIDAAFVERCGRAAELPAWIALAERLRDEAG